MNKDKRNNIQLLGTLNNADESGIIANANQIYDDVQQKAQETINSELIEAVGTGGSVDSRIASAVAAETSRAQEAEANRYTKNETYTKEELNNLITTPNQEYVSVTATDQTTAVTDVLPAIGLADTVYRVGNWDGSQYDVTKYSEYAWNGKDYVHLSTKTQIGDVFDISAYHATGETLATYDNLEDALGTNGENIPQSLRKGGMSVKFVQSPDNKYVQYRLMANSFTTDVTQWQGVDAEPTDGSKNLIESGSVAKIIKEKEHITSKALLDLEDKINDLKYDLKHKTIGASDAIVDYGWINYADGTLKDNIVESYDRIYKFINRNYIKISLITAVYSDANALVAFYSTPTISTDGYLKSVSVQSNGTQKLESVEMDIPSDCKLIVVTNQARLGDVSIKIMSDIIEDIDLHLESIDEDIDNLENKIKEANIKIETNEKIKEANIKIETNEKITSKAILDLENKIKEANIKIDTKDKITSKALLSLNTNIKESSKTSVIYEGGCIVPFELLNEQYLEKAGTVINFGDEGGDFNSVMVESPCIWYEPSLQKLIMIYTAYRHSDKLIGCHAYATSEDGINWEKKGEFFRGSGVDGTPDSKGTTGPVMVLWNSKYYLFYIGLTSTGYEGGNKTLCLAVGNSIDDFINDTAERRGTIIGVGYGWASRQIWHPCFIKTSDKWYCFINASGDVNGRNDKERIGFYYSDKLDGNWIQGEQVLKYIDESTRGTQIAIDPSIVSYGDFYIMMYGTVLSSNNKAYDHWAFTSKEDFPFGWKYGGVGVSPTENYDDRYAHKPWLMKFRNKIYHYYTSVGVNGNRTIALIY